MRLAVRFYAFFLLLSVPGLINAQELRVELAREDIATLKLNLEKFHPGLYRYTSKDSIDLVFDQVTSRLTDGPVVDLFAEVTWLLNKVKCGHTRASLPNAVNNDFKKEQYFLPLSVKYLGEGLYVDDAYTNEARVLKGEEILEVNGKSINEINSIIFSHHSSDGFVTAGKRRLMERYFSYYHQLYVSRNAQRYSVKLKRKNGGIETVVLTGEDWETLSRMQPQPSNEKPLSLVIEEDYALMDINTFVSYRINNQGQDYYDFLEKSFAELKTKGIKNLILDLRGNGGGDDNYGATLVSYFAKKPFRYFDRIEITKAYSGYGSVEVENGRRLMTSHRGLSLWQPKENRFDGEVYVLIDGGSFSTCADVATVLHHNDWATLLGEETGGGYDGNTSGSSKGLSLPHSGIRVNLPMWMYTTANAGHAYYGRGAKPHYPIQQSVEEFINNEDTVMKRAISLIKSK